MMDDQTHKAHDEASQNSLEIADMIADGPDRGEPERLRESSGKTGTTRSDAIAFVRAMMQDAKYTHKERAEQIVDYLLYARRKIPEPRPEESMDWIPLEGHAIRHVGEAGE